MRVVLDTNVWISGWLWGGIPGQLIIMAVNQQITIFACEDLLSELESSLTATKLHSKIQSLGATVQMLISRTRQLDSDFDVYRCYRQQPFERVFLP